MVKHPDLQVQARLTVSCSTSSPSCGLPGEWLPDCVKEKLKIPAQSLGRSRDMGRCNGRCRHSGR